MPTIAVYLGPRILHFKKRGTVRFVPRGRVRLFRAPVIAHAPTREERMEKVLSARLFVGLSVGSAPTWGVEDVIRIATEVAARRRQLASASFLEQKGVYQASLRTKPVEESSVQIIVVAGKGVRKDAFLAHMKALGEALCMRLRQDEVMIEIQEDGVLKKKLTSYR